MSVFFMASSSYFEQRKLTGVFAAWAKQSSGGSRNHKSFSD
jgi:hypothetical protein